MTGRVMAAVVLWPGASCVEGPGEHGYARLAVAALARSAPAGPAVIEPIATADYVGLCARAAVEDEAACLALLAGIARAELRDDAVADARAATLQWLAAERDAPSSAVVRHVRRALWTAHAYRHGALGRVRSVREATAARVDRVWRRGRPVAAVAGVRGEQWCRELGSGAWTAGFVEEPRTEDVELRVASSHRQTHLGIGHRGVAFADADRVAADVAVAALGDALAAALRERRALCYAVDVASHAGLQPGLIGAQLACRPEDAAEALAVARDVIAWWCDEPGEHGDVHRARSRAIGARARALDGTAQLALARALDRAFGTREADADHYAARARAVTPAELRAAARRLLGGPGRATVILETPP